MKIEQSIKLIKGLYDKSKENIIAFSGGKDSIVMYYLAKETGLDFSYIYTNTTIDPPGHLRFIRENYPDVEIVNPKYSFYQLVEKYGLPSRHRRYCCQHLKEYVGKGAKVFMGLRLAESVKRKERLKNLKEPEKCDTRVKGKIHAYPILNWTEKDVWNFIKENEYPYPEWYDLGFKRMGCIGCPLANQKQRIKGYKMFPKYAYATIKAIDKNIKAGKSLSKFFDDPYEAFYWWLSNLSIKRHKELKLFEIDYKHQITKLLKQ